ncbi:MAG: hypothetical protein AXA67_02415 [Methylothermaceae bacteria B42]|nr:MAG: hypothetical protein AXA67_02415 [Methylothermaceae bacteria B42]
MHPAQKLTLALTLVLLPQAVFAFNVSATLEAKFQVDNRFTEDPRILGELWGDARLISLKQDWQMKISAAQRISSLANDSQGKLYQAFLEKHFTFLDSHLRLGRFQRTDVSGFYTLDGAQFDYRLSGWHWQFYGGNPHRMDQVQSVDGDYVFGVAGEYQQQLDWQWGWLTLSSFSFRSGFQQFRNSRSSRRLRGGVNYTGKLAGRPFETGLNTVYRFDRKAFEDVFFNLRLDLTDNLRFRSNYEYYRPRNPFPTFRERFVSAYALGEQSLFRAELHHRPTQNWHYFIGGQRATKVDGKDGYGLRAGGDASLPGQIRINLLYDFLELEQERAHSVYGGITQPVNSRLEWHLNAALRREDKLLYGVNWARGAEIGGRYMIDFSKVVILSFSYIANSKRRDDYVGALRFIYYLDRFMPKQ